MLKRSTILQCGILAISFSLGTALAQTPGAAKFNSIQAVDFMNFSYRPSCAKKPIRVKDGVYERTNPSDRFLFKVGSVVYGDLDGDGRDEAIVTTACNTGGSGVFSEGFLFGLVNGRVRQLTNVPGGDRAWNSIHAITVTDGVLSVVRLAPDGPNGPACCPKFLETTKYKLVGHRLTQQGEVSRSGYEEPVAKQANAASGNVTGTVTYRQRIALPPGSLLEVSLVDVSRTDAPAQVIGKQQITTTTQVPIAFEIPYDPDKIVPEHSYAVQARISTDGELRWITDTACPVLTQGQPSQVELIVRQVN